MIRELEKFLQIPEDNDDCNNVGPSQLGFLAEVQAMLANPEAKIADLGAFRDILAQWIDEVRTRQAVETKVAKDSEGPINLSPEQVKLIGTLRERYKRNKYNIPCHNEVPWERIEEKLRANPAQLDALGEMNATGGCPDVTKVQGEHIFFDDLARKPSRERHFHFYDDAFWRAKRMGGGVHLMWPDHFRYITNELGIEIGYVDPLWLNTSHEQEPRKGDKVSKGFKGEISDTGVISRYPDYSNFYCAHFSIIIGKPEFPQFIHGYDDGKIGPLQLVFLDVKKTVAKDSEGPINLSPEQIKFIGTLRERYRRNEHRIPCHNEVPWERIEEKLRANPAQLDALGEMNSKGGCPDVTKVQGEHIFFDTLSLPLSLTEVNYHEALRLARKMGGGVHLMWPKHFLYITNELGIKMHEKMAPGWLNTSEEPALLEASKAYISRYPTRVEDGYEMNYADSFNRIIPFFSLIL